MAHRFDLKTAPILAPSLLSADLACMGRVAQSLAVRGVTWLHLDIMDGHFVPNLTFGPPVIKSLGKYVPSVFLDAHLMVMQPLELLEPLRQAGVHHVTIHAESTGAKEACLMAKKMGFSMGIALKPETPLSVLDTLPQDLDLCLIMTVEPGFGGQALIESSIPKIKTLRQLPRSLKIQVDGGIQLERIKSLKPWVDVFVVGSALFPGGSLDESLLREMMLELGSHTNGENF